MRDSSSRGAVGLWLVGAFGGVGATLAVGLAALRRQLALPIGLATELPEFRALGFAGFDQFVLGGHDVRRADYAAAALELHRSTGVFTPELLRECGDDFAAWSSNVRPGLVRASGSPVEKFADWRGPDAAAPPGEQIAALADDLARFRAEQRLDRVVVLNVASSEPMPDLGPAHQRWATARERLGELPASALYGLAALEAGAAYVNFTPSLGLGTPALEERARELGGTYMGKDGKTGETLMKSVLAPMFARRNLKVQSWVGHNILGNRDGLVLQDPVSKRGKIESKDRLLGPILGYEPQTVVSIEYVPSLGDRKTAWDHIQFEGFLGAQMTLQFIWQGIDSLLAAPLALDLVRWTELALRRGERGRLGHLAAYFKSPTGVAEQDFFRQWELLEAYARQR